MRTLEGIVVHRAEVDFDSYHRLVQRDGSVQLYHHDGDIAEHAIYFNPTTLAVAFFGDFASEEPGVNWHVTDQQWAAGVALVRAWLAAYGPLWVAGHSELGARATRFPEKLQAGHTCPGENFDINKFRSECGAQPYVEPST